MTILGGETGSAFDWFVTARGAVQLRPGDAAEPVQIVSPPAEVVVNRGSNLEFRPLVFDENGELRDDFRLDYLSLDDQVAQVDSGGMILGGEAGFSTLTIQVGDLVETTTVTVVGVTEGVSGFTLRGISEDPAGGLFLSSPGTTPSSVPGIFRTDPRSTQASPANWAFETTPSSPRYSIIRDRLPSTGQWIALCCGPKQSCDPTDSAGRCGTGRDHRR